MINYNSRAMLLASSTCLAVLFVGDAIAQPKCTTTAECAQAAVDAAAQARADVTALRNEVSKLQAELNKMGTQPCKDMPAKDKVPTDVTFSCDSGYFVKAIRTTHVGGQQEFWRENTILTCCPIK